jgi:hypothetical protein
MLWRTGPDEPQSAQGVYPKTGVIATMVLSDGNRNGNLVKTNTIIGAKEQTIIADCLTDATGIKGQKDSSAFGDLNTGNPLPQAIGCTIFF